MRFIDTHCHIIPGVDDGPADADISLDMGRIATEDGIGTIIATPHVVEGIYEGANRADKLAGLRALFAENGVDVELAAGAEVPMSMCAGNNGGLLESLTLAGGRYLLMETSETTFEQLSQAVFNVRMHGFYPILAHPERTGFIQQHPERLAELIGRGDVFVQATVASIEGLFGKQARKAWLGMVSSGLVHLVGSDAHSRRMRAPRLSGSYAELCRLAGEHVARMIMYENPRRVLAGEKLVTAVPARTRLGLWSRLRGR
ncbi:MAG: hypothetical protein M0Z32_00850 [Actinomycetota bacterium]|nr:hypothetical protein [Actinomycetota bacterium]MCL6092373.1 hypothetical protein [Actinomycetota bacterium]MDA8166294.1 hypothetical protein [Actinomycetota bacterium]